MTFAAASASELQEWRKGIDELGWVHMNAAGASPTAHETHRIVQSFLESERGVGGYAAAADYVKSGGRDAHQAVADLLGCDADEIALAESAQVAWAKAFYSLDFKDGDYIFCWEDDYMGNAVAMLQAQKRCPGLNLSVLPMTDDGIVDVAALKVGLQSMPAGSRALVALTHVNTNSSIVQPALEVGKVATAHGAIFLLDACQSIGQLPVLVRDLNCDFACGTGRKWLRGPRGTGFLYARKGALDSEDANGLVGEPPMIDHVSVAWTSRSSYKLSHGARRFEMWEASQADRAGLASAADLCRKIDPARIHALSVKLAERLRAGLVSIPGVIIRDAPQSFCLESATKVGASRCAIVTFDAFSTLGVQAEEIRAALAERRIAVNPSPSTHTFDDSKWTQPRTVRLSPTYFNTEDEVDRVIAEIRSILTKANPKKRTRED